MPQLPWFDEVCFYMGVVHGFANSILILYVVFVGGTAKKKQEEEEELAARSNLLYATATAKQKKNVSFKEEEEPNLENFLFDLKRGITVQVAHQSLTDHEDIDFGPKQLLRASPNLETLRLENLSSRSTPDNSEFQVGNNNSSVYELKELTRAFLMKQDALVFVLLPVVIIEFRDFVSLRIGLTSEEEARRCVSALNRIASELSYNPNYLAIFNPEPPIDAFQMLTRITYTIAYLPAFPVVAAFTALSSTTPPAPAPSLQVSATAPLVKQDMKITEERGEENVEVIREGKKSISFRY